MDADLHYAVRIKDVQRVCYLIANFPTLCQQRDNGMQTPLELAIEGGNLQIIESLVYHDATQLEVDNTDRHPFFSAVAGGSIPVVNLLLKMVPDCIAKVDACGNSVLCYVSDVLMLRFLLNTNPTLIEKCNNDGETVLFHSIKNNRPDELISALGCEQPSLLDVRDHVTRKNAMECMCEKFWYYATVMRTIITCKPDLQYVSNDCITTLNLAILLSCDVKILAQIHKHNPTYVHAKGINGVTPLRHAIFKNDANTIRFLESISPIDHVIKTHARHNVDLTPFRERVESQCSLNILLQELWNIVMEYVGFEPRKANQTHYYVS